MHIRLHALPWMYVPLNWIQTISATG